VDRTKKKPISDLASHRINKQEISKWTRNAKLGNLGFSFAHYRPQDMQDPVYGLGMGKRVA
jgi:hypothetical protein